MATYQEMISESKPTLVDVYADWCGPCQALAPIIKSVKNKLGDQVNIIKIDLDKNAAYARRNQIQGVPTLMIFQDGELKWRQSGVLAEDVLMNKLREYL